MRDDEPAGDPRDAALRTLLDDARAAQAARERSRERELRRQAGEEARLSAVLRDAAERGLAVSLRTTAGRTHRGTIVAVGRDFCGIAAAGGLLTYVATSAIAVVVPDRGVRAGLPGDDRGAALDLTLAELLADEAPEQPAVAVVAAGGEALAGRLLAVGADVVTVALDDGPRVAYVALASLTEASFLPSG